MRETWFFLQSPPGSAAYNMALDEVLVRHAADRDAPLLRVYTWEKPAASFGYFQTFPTHLAGKYELVRRPTGGGLVYHGDDTTYTVVVPPSHALYEASTADAYRKLHEAVVAALDRQPQLHDAPSQSPRGSYECFEKPVAGDVVADGRKVAGAAQRRTKWGLLHQGSIAVTLSAEQLLRGFCVALGIEFVPAALSEAEHALAEKLAGEKYATDAWSRRAR